MPPVDRLKPTRGRSSESSLSLMEFMREFPDDNACLEWLWRTRHSSDGETAHCPKCTQDRTFKRYKTAQRRQSWTCTACGHHVHPTAGTIFHKSSTSLQLWFYAMYLITSTRCGISAKHLERERRPHKTAGGCSTRFATNSWPGRCALLGWVGWTDCPSVEAARADWNAVLRLGGRRRPIIGAQGCGVRRCRAERAYPRGGRAR